MAETLKYERTRKFGKVEILRYPETVLAKVSNSETDRFGLLFRFISGKNIRKEWKRNILWP